MTVSFEDLLGLGLSSRTAYTYARYIDRAVKALAERGTTLADCSAADVAAILADFRSSYSTRASLRAALIAAWDVLGRDNGPARAVRVPPRPRARCKALSAEAAAILEAAAWERDDDPGLVVLVGLYSGLRRAEIARLRWQDVEDEGGRPAWLRVHGKGDRVAYVPVHPVLAEALTRRRRPAGYIFEGRSRGRPISPATVWAWVRLVSVEAGLGEVPAHVLRHTALTECNDRSGDLRTVQEIARHSRPETTAGYTRTTAARMAAVVAMIDYGRAS